MKWLLPPVLWAACLIAMGLLAVYLPLAAILPLPFNYLGLAFVAGGLWLLLAAARRFSRADTNINTFRDPNVLVSDGAFAWTRNPMYLGFVLTLLGVALAVNALSALALVVLFFLVANFWYVPFEERAAARQFGAAYADYRRRVRRWL